MSSAKTKLGVGGYPVANQYIPLSGLTRSRLSLRGRVDFEIRVHGTAKTKLSLRGRNSPENEVNKSTGSRLNLRGQADYEFVVHLTAEAQGRLNLLSRSSLEEVTPTDTAAQVSQVGLESWQSAGKAWVSQSGVEAWNASNSKVKATNSGIETWARFDEAHVKSTQSGTEVWARYNENAKARVTQNGVEVWRHGTKARVTYVGIEVWFRIYDFPKKKRIPIVSIQVL